MAREIAACSWSSGKDSCFACYKALEEGYQIKYLMNFVSEEFKRVSFHGVPKDFVNLQAEAAGSGAPRTKVRGSLLEAKSQSANPIPSLKSGDFAERIKLLQKEVPAGKYEETYRLALSQLRAEGITTLIAGDIFLLECRNWTEKVGQEEGIKVIEPLWDIPTSGILADFISCGFKAVVTATQSELLGQEWIGRTIDKTFLKDISAMKNIDACGEHGEYHTFVLDAPFFKQRIRITESYNVLRDKYWFLDIRSCALENKEQYK